MPTRLPHLLPMNSSQHDRRHSLYLTLSLPGFIFSWFGFALIHAAQLAVYPHPAIAIRAVLFPVGAGDKFIFHIARRIGV